MFAYWPATDVTCAFGLFCQETSRNTGRSPGRRQIHVAGNAWLRGVSSRNGAAVQVSPTASNQLRGTNGGIFNVTIIFIAFKTYGCIDYLGRISTIAWFHGVQASPEFTASLQKCGLFCGSWAALVRAGEHVDAHVPMGRWGEPLMHWSTLDMRKERLRADRPQCGRYGGGGFTSPMNRFHRRATHAG